MHLSALHLSDFRNYHQLDLTLEPGLYVLEGPNAQGKTSLLEAIGSLAIGRSFRTSNERELIRFGCSASRIRATLQRRSGRERQLELHWQTQDGKVDKQATLQGKGVRRLADFISEFPLSLFTPEDLQLAQGAPSERRRYLDQLLCKLYPTYLQNLVRYGQVIKQRTAALKQVAHPRASDIAPWDSLLCELGSDLSERRQTLCRELESELQELHQRLALGKGTLSVVYQPAGDVDPLQFLQKLEQQRANELRRRSCLVGPHRDELEVLLDGRPLRRFGSQGECRSLALTLRVAQARLLTRLGGEPAVILLDDCFSELDPGRQHRLLELVLESPQVFVSTASPLTLGVPCHHIRVENGSAWEL